MKQTAFSLFPLMFRASTPELCFFKFKEALAGARIQLKILRESDLLILEVFTRMLECKTGLDKAEEDVRKVDNY